MKVLIAVSTHTGEDCADPLSLILTLPWPVESSFQTMTVAELIPPPPIAVGVPGGMEMPEIQEKLDSSAVEIAGRSAARLREHGFRAESFSVEGNPKELIPAHAREWNADLVVVGACRHSRLETFLLGSVSESVVRHAPCSVLVVKPPAPSRT